MSVCNFWLFLNLVSPLRVRLVLTATVPCQCLPFAVYAEFGRRPLYFGSYQKRVNHTVTLFHLHECQVVKSADDIIIKHVLIDHV